MAHQLTLALHALEVAQSLLWVLNSLHHALNTIHGEVVSEIIVQPVIVVKRFIVLLILDYLDVALELFLVARDLGDAMPLVYLHRSESLAQIVAEEISHEYVLHLELALPHECIAIDEVWQVLQLHIQVDFVHDLEYAQPL